MRIIQIISIGLWLISAQAWAAEPMNPAEPTLQQDVDAINSRWNSGHSNQQQVIADAERIGADYTRLIPISKSFSPADKEQNRRSARGAFSWLCRAGAMYGGDPLVSRSLMRTYGTMGDYYHQYGAFYPAGVGFGYGGASRNARRLILGSPNSKEFERELERYAVAWAAASHVDLSIGRGYNGCSDTFDQPDPGTRIRESSLKPVPLPEVDESKLTSEQKEQWTDLRNQFIPVSTRVHEARILLEQLSDRLQSRKMRLNVQDAATAISMQGFLEDAAELIKAGDFEKAGIALRKSEYLRTKLKNTTGQ
jgi:hypothetical protein